MTTLAALLLAAFPFCGLLGAQAKAAPPPDVAYQGRILDHHGSPLDGLVNIQIRIYEALQGFEGEEPLFIEDHVGVELVHGIFSIQLGAGAPALGEIDAALFSGMNRFLEIHVNGERLQPRQPMSSVPFAFQATQAVNASQLQGMTLADIVENLPEGPRGPQGERGLSGAAGADGTACTVTNNGGSATVSCTDGSSASVFDGADGAEGPPGPQGSQGPPGSDASVTPRNILATVGACVGCNLNGVDLSGGDFPGANLVGADLANASLLNTNLSGSILFGTNLVAANFSGANLSLSEINGDVPFPVVERTKSDAASVNLTNADLRGADVRNFNGIGNTMENAILSGADLTGANLTHVVLTGAQGTPANADQAIWLGVICPDGTLSGDAADTCVGHFLP
jgi:hypothetical protein